MAKIIQNISVDVSKPNFFQAIVAKQYDSGSRFLKVTFIHCGKIVEIKPTSTVLINATRSDGGKKSFAGEVNNDNTATVPLAYWMLEIEGKVECDVSVIDTAGRKLTSTSFNLEVQRALNGTGDVSEDENYDVLVKLIEDVGKMTPDLIYNPESENAQSGKAVAQALEKVLYETPFKPIDLPCNESNKKYIYKDGTPTTTEEDGFSPIIKCPKYLGFRIEDNDTRLYLYIGSLNESGEFEFEFNGKYHIDTTETGAVNYLRQSHNRFIETDGDQYFYYKVSEGGKVTLLGSDTFPQGECEVIATVPNYIKGDKNDEKGNYIPPETKLTGEKYYSVVLPSGCFYAILNKEGMPTFLKPDEMDEESNDFKSTFNVSYQTDVTVVDGKELPIIEVNRGASFGYIPENVGAALLRLPCDYQLSDLCIYTNTLVKSNAKSGRRRKAKEIGEKIINFNFFSQKDIFWNDNVRNMVAGRRFYGVPYSSRWVNSHYLGFEVTPETVLNALNDPYSIAYDGGYYQREETDADGNVISEELAQHNVSEHSEIAEQYDENGGIIGGGTGYGLVCSAFTSLITGNPYPQSNRGYTFDGNFVLENTVDMNSGEVLVKEDLKHCVFVDEIFDKGYSLYEAVDPCVAKTIHTCPADKTTYAGSKVRTSTLDKYVYSVVNKDISGYEKLEPLLNFENITIANGNVRPWRGNKAVYGSWDKIGKSKEFEGSKIGVTIHNDKLTSFRLKKPSATDFITISLTADDIEKKYKNISDYVTEDGTYTLDAGEGTTPEYFRFYNHDTVQLTFDAEGKVVFKNSDGSVAEDVEYVYVGVKGYGGAFGKDDSVGDMVIAKGKCYPDLALDTSRIIDVRASIVSDITTDSDLTESWGKYSCATSPNVVSEYKGVNSDGATVFQTLPVGKNLLNRETDIVGKKITATGELTAATNYETTDFISVVGGEKYYFGVSIVAIAYYDVNKNVVGFKEYPSRPMIFDENVKYVRFSFAKSSTNVQFEQNAKATEYEAFVGAEMLDGNKVNFVDKSIEPEKTTIFSLKANGINLLNRDVASVGYILSNTGELSTNSNIETSDFIPVTYGDNIFISGTPDGSNTLLVAYAIYDENRNVISAITSMSLCKNPLAIPRNAKFVRYSYRKAGVDVQIERGTEATEYEAFEGVLCLKNEYIGIKQPYDLIYSPNPWYGKKLVVDGDSITHDDGSYSYWQFVTRNTLEMVLPDYTNTNTPANGRNGISGSRIANEGGNSTKEQSIVLRYMDLPDDAELVMIAGGSNDWAHNNVDLGDFDSTDNTTFNGALNELLPALKTKYPLVPVVMMTPIKRGTAYNKQNSKGLTLEQFVDAMIKKCRQYGVYCLDMYSNCPINPQIPVMKELLFKPNDDTHPNAEGHKIMGCTVAGFIRTLN